VLDGVCYPISQSNNSYIFPGLGLGILASGAQRVSDGMLMAASLALSEYPRSSGYGVEPLLPLLDEIRQVSRCIARAVALQAQREGLAEDMPATVLDEKIRSIFWQPEYGQLE
jgi:malate dehydrogenase (oxaloacetate-decarboxylating)